MAGLLERALEGVLGDPVLLALNVLILAALLMALAGAGAALMLRVVWRVGHGRRQRLRSEWEPLLLDVLAGATAPAALSDRVPPGRDREFLDFLARYVWHFKGFERTQFRRLAAPFLPALKARLRDGDAESRARAVRMLGAFGGEAQADTLVAALADEAPLVALTAARSLDAVGQGDRASAVLHDLGRFDLWSPEMLASLFRAIGPRGAPALRALLADPRRPPRVRAAAAEALSVLHDFAAADIAADVLAKASDGPLLIAALELLGTVGSERHLPPLRPLTRHEDFRARARAIRALGRLGTAEDAPELRAAIADPSPWVALAAARAFAGIRGPAALRELALTDPERAPHARQVLAEGVHR